MKKVQIVYAVIASEKNLFFQELWASAYSFRLHEPEREIRVLCDNDTYEYITKFPEFVKLVDEIIVVDVSDTDNKRYQSKEIKTNIRKHVKGSYLFVDTDTICADSIGNIDHFTYDVAAVPEFHVPLKDCVFKDMIRNRIWDSFHEEITDKDAWYNSGVMFVNDTPKAYEICRMWNENWKKSTFVNGHKQDQPPLLMAHRETGFAISELSGEYNCQVGLSVKFLANAKIFHFLHFDFPQNQSFNPFQSKEIYRRIKEDGCISTDVAEMIKNVKSVYSSPSCVVGWGTMNFLMCPAAPIFERIYNEGGAASWLMMKVANWLEKIHKYTRKR